MTTATLALASALVNVRPEVSLAALSGPSAPVVRSTPLTVNELDLKLPRKDPPPVPPLPLPPPLPGPKPPVPPDVLMAGILPVMTASVRLSAPAAPATSRSWPMRVTDEAASVPWPMLVSRSTSIFVPAAGRVRLPI